MGAEELVHGIWHRLESVLVLAPDNAINVFRPIKRPHQGEHFVERLGDIGYIYPQPLDILLWGEGGGRLIPKSFGTFDLANRTGQIDAHVSSPCYSLCSDLMLCPHINFARYRRRNQSRAVLTHQFDGAAGFLDQSIDFGGFAVEKCRNS